MQVVDTTLFCKTLPEITMVPHKTVKLVRNRIFRRSNMKARIVMVIHDALWVEAPQEEAERVSRLMKKMMTTAGNLKVPLEVDLK
jgi:DNA polymerase I